MDKYSNHFLLNVDTAKDIQQKKLDILKKTKNQKQSRSVMETSTMYLKSGIRKQENL